MPFPLLVPLIAAGVSAIGSIIGNAQQRSANRRLAQFQADANERYLAQQNAYNTPQAQMARWRDAGLNPNLIYGQGTPGNQSSSLTYPDIKPTDYSNMYSNIVPAFSQALMTQTQVSAINAKTRQTYALTALNKLQAEVLAKNPLLDDEGFKATLEGLKSAAELKALDVGVRSEDYKLRRSQREVQEATSGHQINKIFKEVELLEARFKLANADSGIRAQVLKSKEFQNELLQIQKRFMADGDITPGMILQFIQLILLKAM